MSFSLTRVSSVTSISPYHSGFGTMTIRSLSSAVSITYGPPDQYGAVLSKKSAARPTSPGSLRSNPSASAIAAGYTKGPNRANHSANA